jgi:hypothetical protein
MKKYILAAVSLIVTTSAAQAFTNCVGQAERKWNGVTIEAVSQGDTCEDAVVTLVLRDKAGKPIWARAHIASQMLNFSQEPAADAQAMIAKLSGWISGEGFMPRADKLSLKGEFPFTANDMDEFAKARKSKAPLFCYIQGMESGNCLAVGKDGGVLELGVQSFPG